jgi:glycosyltransferase involved in cell wall biosynthesis
MVTVLMPAYNEAEIIERSVREWYGEVTAKVPGSEIIVVDDCSTDDTEKILERLAVELRGLRPIRTPRNGGHGKALRFGFSQVTTEHVFQTDSDRQHLPADFWLLWDKRADCDFVFGVRSQRADGVFRKFVTRTMRVCNFLVWGLWIRDANCPFKLMRTAAAQELLRAIPEDSFIPMVMLAILARRWGFRFAEVEVSHLARRGGQQSLKGIERWVRIGTRCFWQLLCLRFKVASRSSGAV